LAESTDTAATKPQQRWLMIGHAAGRRSRVAHYVLTPDGPGPSEGVGWHTACGALWADGVRTGPTGWGFASPTAQRHCKTCSRKVSADAV